jgi:hypothetical protein
VAAEVSLPADPQASAGILSTGWAVSDLARTASIQTAAARIVAADVSRGKDTPDVEYTLAIKLVGQQAVERGLSRAKIVTEFDLPDSHHAIKKHHQATGDSLLRQHVALT